MARSITLNGAPVLGMKLRSPLEGVWVADVSARAIDALSGKATISDGENEWIGKILTSGVVAEVCTAVGVGGSGGLRLPAPAKSYVGTIVRTVVLDILADAKETLSQRALTAPALRARIDHWTRAGNASTAASSAAEQLTLVLEAVDATWRVLPAGTVWVGAPAFNRATPDGLVELDREPARQRVHVALDALDLLPDSTVNGDRVGDVEYRVEGGDLRATYWLEAA